MQDEQELIKRLNNLAERDGAFKELLGQYKEPLYWHIRHILKSHQDTDDVLQNTFIKVYNNIGRFKGDSKLYSWMYRIASNESFTFLKKKARKLHISDQELNERHIDKLEADVYFEGDEIKLKLQRAIAQLPRKQQQVFNMRYFQEIKYKEMVDILDTSEGALKASYHLAVKKLERYLTKD